jgi:hypothetical protein
MGYFRIQGSGAPVVLKWRTELIAYLKEHARPGAGLLYLSHYTKRDKQSAAPTVRLVAGRGRGSDAVLLLPNVDFRL